MRHTIRHFFTTSPKVNQGPSRHVLTQITTLLCFGLFAISLPLTGQDQAPDAANADQGRVQTTTLAYGADPNIKIVFKGRAGNLELNHSGEAGTGKTVTDYQKGSGYSDYDRERQTLKWETRIPYTLNRLSKHIQKTAPYMRAELPQGAELDFQLRINSLGYGSLNFTDLNINRFRCNVSYGDVDISFPTENRSIVRGQAKFRMLAGDLELNQLGNLKADKIKINGGVGELFVDFGPKIYLETEVNLDMDIGNTELIFPKGTHVRIRGTSRDLSPFDMVKKEEYWEPRVFHPSSPVLNIKAKGPLGDLVITWK
ncbi:hypothetical protein SCOR_32035 [Sulfidibacter corallicola]|uniref:DUF2154 domain-containing protein n=1 Tax=Sulfidibacter corallicola TaxID=2818388 RepID=A0A8A4TTF8_SULCO|nr:hypothetical protein [Sulfidibacter corallicola]QTD49825.1 hypothetical protein J3U87_29940 [Sulfidibacter corallicola]